MRHTLPFAALAAMFLSGCNLPQPKTTAELDINELCIAYAENVELAGMGKLETVLTTMFAHRAYDPKFEAELRERDYFSDEEMQLIADQTIKIGMREEVLRCIFGRPWSANRSVGSWGAHTQYVFRDYGWYVYVENGVVVSWQN